MSESVKYKNVRINLYPLSTRPGYWQFQFERDGKQIRVTRSDLKKARQAATAKAVEIHTGTFDLSTLTVQQLSAIRRMIEADPSLKSVDEFLVWHSRKNPEKNCGEAIAEFLAIKELARGRSALNVRNLTQQLKTLPQEKNLSAITPKILEDSFPKNIAARTRSNIRGAWVTFFRWAKKVGYLSRDEMQSAPEMIEKPIIHRAIPCTYTPAQMLVLLANVQPQYLPWLVLASFAGIRAEELTPDSKGEKSPLDWSDFHWERGIIIIRPETDKNRQRRIIPILPPVIDFLQDIAKPSGRVSPRCKPTNVFSGSKLSETTRLGNLIGGWQKNAPRHSFISYRAALVGLAQTAMEAGNSESEAKKSYNDAKGKDEAKEWFEIRKVAVKLPPI